MQDADLSSLEPCGIVMIVSPRYQEGNLLKSDKQNATYILYLLSGKMLS